MFFRTTYTTKEQADFEWYRGKSLYYLLNIRRVSYRLNS